MYVICFSQLFVILIVLDAHHILTVNVGCGENKCISFSIENMRIDLGL
jgi:hypothetical protein